MATNRSKIETSPRKFRVPTEMFAEFETKHVQLDSLAVNQKLTVSVKVASLSAGETVKTKEGKEQAPHGWCSGRQMWVH